jgi:glucose-1-phosphate cytidylyltransferase
MKVIILAGGLGTRLAEETDYRPKPMVDVGGRPVIWHIMKTFSHYGHNEFLIALGSMGEQIKKFFDDYHLMAGDIRVDLADGNSTWKSGDREDWIVDTIDTGQGTQTGGRVKRLIPHIGSETFMVTYGDGLADVNINDLIKFHRSHGKLATVTAVHPPARFGELKLDGTSVVNFAEKPQVADEWINGGFFVLEPEVAQYLSGDDTTFEREPLERLAQDGQLEAYLHNSFWQPIDTLSELRHVRALWDEGSPPWRIWS